MGGCKGEEPSGAEATAGIQSDSLRASVASELCEQRERRQGEGRGPGWVLVEKGGRAVLRPGPPGC